MKKSIFIFSFFAFITFCISAASSFAQLTTNDSPSASALVDTLRVNGNISNVSYTGDPTARGTFNGITSNIGLNSGVILSTGMISNATGPNDDPVGGSCLETECVKSTDFGRPGDADLEAIEGCDGCTYDAAVLEFDFIPQSTPFSLSYVFASEEYPCYVCSTMNDVFAFLITGPNPAGGQYNKQNIALIPDTDTRVCINSINDGSPGYNAVSSTYYPTSGCISLKNSKYFINNGDGNTPASDPTVQYNGFTVPLTASIDVLPLKTYHIKIAIADVGDGKYDSAILLGAGTTAFSLNITVNNTLLTCGDSSQITCLTNYNGQSQLTYKWSPSTGLSATNIPNPKAYPKVTTTYKVTVTSDQWSATDSVKITLTPLPAEKICYIEFDTATSKNSINWSTNLPENIDSVHIYTEVSSNVWSRIGTVSARKSNFIDMSSNPFNRSYSYRISIKDTCGMESDTSAFHTTITLLTTYDGSTNVYGFTWSLYQGLPIANYYLYGIKSNGKDSLIVSLPGDENFYNYTNPYKGFIKYFVGFNTSACTSKSLHLVKSNYVQAIEGINENNGIDNRVSIYPNPANDNVTIDFKGFRGNDKTVAGLFSITGQLISQQPILSSLTQVNIENLSQGVYIIKVTNDNGIAVRRIVKE